MGGAGELDESAVESQDFEYSGTDTLEALEGAKNYRRFLASLIASLVSGRAPGTEVLDFGAGIGTYAEEARKLGCTVACVELDDRQRARLTREGFAAHRSLDEVPDGSQSSVYSFNVLEHIRDDASAIRDLFRVVAPGGRLLLYVPAFPVLFSAFDRHCGHYRRYRRVPLVSLAQSAGFTVDSCTYADSLGFFASLVYRALNNGEDASPSGRSIALYDIFVFPLSKLLDRVLGRLFGKNLVLFAHRPAGRAAAT